MRGNAINRLNMSFKLNTEININKLNILKNVFLIETNHIYSEKQLKKIFTTQDDLNGYICITGMPTQAFLKQGELYQEVFLKDKLGTAFNYITQSLVCFIKFQDAFIQVKEEIKEEVVEEQPEIITQAEETEEELFQEEGKNKRGKSKKS